MTSLLEIGASLPQLRRAQGISQRELALRVGTSQQQVARWEASGYRSAALERVAAVAAALGSNLDNAPIAAESVATYSQPAGLASHGATAVRDLGEIAARLRTHSTELRDQFGFERVGVFGSFATGSQRPSSDVDLLVETKDPGGMRFVEALLFLEGLLGRAVDLARPELLREELKARAAREVIYVWST